MARLLLAEDSKLWYGRAWKWRKLGAATQRQLQGSSQEVGTVKSHLISNVQSRQRVAVAFIYQNYSFLETTLRSKHRRPQAKSCRYKRSSVLSSIRLPSCAFARQFPKHLSSRHMDVFSLSDPPLKTLAAMAYVCLASRKTPYSRMFPSHATVLANLRVGSSVSPFPAPTWSPMLNQVIQVFLGLQKSQRNSTRALLQVGSPLIPCSVTRLLVAEKL